MKETLFFTVIIAMVFIMGCNNSNSNRTVKSGNSNGGDKHEGYINNTYASAQPFNDLTAVELVAKIKIGWNLGNTLDTSGNTETGFSWLGGGIYANTSVSQMETAWGNTVTTKANIDAIKGAGFNTVRIPVTWHKACDDNYNIRADWMERITEVVNYVVENDMYIILNTHHDEVLFKFTNAEMDESLKAFKKIWEQIAENFKHYNEKLIFEGLNEPRTKDSPNEWSGGTVIEHIVLNRHYPVFVDTVRASGSNNAKRLLMITTYAASADAPAMNALTLPSDNIANKLIVSIHSYTPYNFALNTNKALNTWDPNNLSDTSPITGMLDRVYDKFVINGIPVIMGEFGAMNKDNEDARAVWAEFYVSYAKSKNIPCVWWDNGAFTGDGELFGLINRKDNTFPYPKVITALMRGAGD
jgi:endoglucanase